MPKEVKLTDLKDKDVKWFWISVIVLITTIFFGVLVFVQISNSIGGTSCTTTQFLSDNGWDGGFINYTPLVLIGTIIVLIIGYIICLEMGKCASKK